MSTHFAIQPNGMACDSEMRWRDHVTRTLHGWEAASDRCPDCVSALGYMARNRTQQRPAHLATDGPNTFCGVRVVGRVVITDLLTWLSAARCCVACTRALQELR